MSDQLTQDVNLTPARHCPGHRDNLPLAKTEVGSSASDHGIQPDPLILLFLETEETRGPQTCVERLIIVFSKGIQVRPQRATHQLRLLRNNGYVAPESIEVECRSVDAVVIDLAACRNHAQQSETE